MNPFSSNALWSFKSLSRIDLRVVFAILLLMIVSLLVVASGAAPRGALALKEILLEPYVKKQVEFFALSFVIFLFFAGFDYHKLREWTWILYLLMIAALVGLFFMGTIARVHRWYRIPLIGMSFQPSEYAKLVVVLALSWFLERRKERAGEFSTALIALVIVGIPFLLILKQPDLGSAMVLYPIVLVMFYFGGVHPFLVKAMTWLGALLLAVVALFFLEVVPHEEFRPMATKVLKDYQYERLKPNQHHQKASQTAIALGGVTGTGWRQSEFTGGGWLPAPYTDSVFAAFGEEFGAVGLLFILALYWALLYFSFQVTSVAKDSFGQLLAAGISVYIAMHVLVNMGMMCGFLPITGVPLLLITYGGSSILSTMIALGILQSIYSRRFMF